MAFASSAPPSELAEWIEVCTEMKQEISELLVFNTRAEDPVAPSNEFTVKFVDVNGLLIPYPDNDEFDISSRTNEMFSFSLRLKFSDGLEIIVIREEYSVLEDTFATIFPNLSSELVAFLIKEYISDNVQLQSLYRSSVSSQELRLKGYKYTVEDIGCKEDSVAHDLETWPALLSAGSADFRAISEGKDIAFFSMNKFDGIIARQQPIFGSEGSPPEIIWSGQFLDEKWFYTVSISYPEKLNESYGSLGAYLAAPHLSRHRQNGRD